MIETISSLSDTISLPNGTNIPAVGLGTWQAEDGDEAVRAVRTALEVGYRHIDTADAYENEESVGRAVREFGRREEVFLTTKIWNEDHGYEATLASFERSRQKLDTDYVDLYLIHWPCGFDFMETWKAMEELLNQGKVKAIGVSNFLQPHLEKLLAEGSAKPVLDQIETHPWLIQPELHQYLGEHDIRAESWSPLMQGRFSEVPELNDLAERHGKHPAQLLIRWNLQHGYIVIPKSTDARHIESNAAVFDFELADEELAMLDALDKERRLGPDPAEFGR